MISPLNAVTWKCVIAANNTVSYFAGRITRRICAKFHTQSSTWRTCLNSTTKTRSHLKLFQSSGVYLSVTTCQLFFLEIKIDRREKTAFESNPEWRSNLLCHSVARIFLAEESAHDFRRELPHRGMFDVLHKWEIDRGGIVNYLPINSMPRTKPPFESPARDFWPRISAKKHLYDTWGCRLKPTTPYKVDQGRSDLFIVRR